jgi:hypothetical protein
MFDEGAVDVRRSESESGPGPGNVVDNSVCMRRILRDL